MEYFLFLAALEQFALQATIVTKDNLAFTAFFGWYLYFLTVKTFNMLYFFKSHSLYLASFLVLEFLVVAHFARVVYIAARSLHMT
jgi:CDP-diglyceride synthetase